MSACKEVRDDGNMEANRLVTTNCINQEKKRIEDRCKKIVKKVSRSRLEANKENG